MSYLETFLNRDRTSRASRNAIPACKARDQARCELFHERDPFLAFHFFRHVNSSTRARIRACPATNASFSVNLYLPGRYLLRVIVVGHFSFFHGCSSP